MLYDSLHEKLLPLPDETLVYPAHGAGSLCGKNLSTDTVSTIGEQRQYNYALQPMTEGRVRPHRHGRPAGRAGVLHLRRGAQHAGAADAGGGARARAEARSRSTRSSTLSDRRRARCSTRASPAEFAGAHLRGAVNVGLGGSYATWAGTLLDRAAADRHRRRPGPRGGIGDAARPHRLRQRRRLPEGGMAALDARPDLVSRTERITAANLAEQLASAEPAARPRRARTGRGRGGAHRRQPQHAARPPRRSVLDEIPGDRTSSSLRERLPLLDRGQHPRAARPVGRDGPRRRHGRLGGLSTGHDRRSVMDPQPVAELDAAAAARLLAEGRSGSSRRRARRRQVGSGQDRRLAPSAARRARCAAGRDPGQHAARRRVRSGSRSAWAAQMLARAGYEAWNLAGGLTGLGHRRPPAGARRWLRRLRTLP